MMTQTAKKHAAELSVGERAPSFALPTETGEVLELASLQGKKIVLYFYPKDDTPGCTVEARDFRDHIEDFKSADTVVIGISKDSVASHRKFSEKLCLPFSLASDESASVCEDYGVWVEKSMYGKKYMGIERATFLIDGKGILRHIWRKVKVEGHVAEVLAAAQAL